MARVLIVEDELLIIEDLKHKLTRLGHSVLAHATSGEIAVQKATDTNPDLVLMDVRLRGRMSGVEAARRIRETHNVPIIYVTAQASAVSEIVGRQEHQYVLTKPFALAQLESIISAALQPAL
jgi:CheY-like chemotaxis protein